MMYEYAWICHWNIIKRVWFTLCLNFIANPAIVRFEKNLSKWTLFLPGVAAPGAQQMCCNLPPRGPHFLRLTQSDTMVSNVRSSKFQRSCSRLHNATLQKPQHISWHVMIACHERTRLQRVRVAMNGNPWSCTASYCITLTTLTLKPRPPPPPPQPGMVQPNAQGRENVKWCRVVQHGIAHLQEDLPLRLQQSSACVLFFWIFWEIALEFSCQVMHGIFTN